MSSPRSRPSARSHAASPSTTSAPHSRARITSAIAERIRAELRARVEGLVPFLWPTLQTAVAAGGSWEIAHRLLDHPRPIFAAITAIVAMGFTAGRRGRQATVIVLGAAVGIAVADLFLRHLGSGGIQLTITVFVAMSLALLISRQPLFVTQVGISALLLVIVGPGSGSQRLEDVLVGGGVASLMSIFLFPIDPVVAVRRSVRPVLTALARSLDQSAEALRTGGVPSAEAARTGIVDQRTMLDTIDVALDATRLAPRRRRDRERVEAFATAAKSLAPLSRGTRVLAGAALRIVRAGEEPQPELADAVAELAASVRALHAWLDTDTEAARLAARERASGAAAAISARPSPATLGGATVAHLVQALAGHVLAATGVAASETAVIHGSPAVVHPPQEVIDDGDTRTDERRQEEREEGAGGGTQQTDDRAPAWGGPA